MILRVVRFQLLERVEPGYMDQIRASAQHMVDAIDGLVELRLMRSTNGSKVTVVGTSMWRDYAALDAFYGSDLDVPRLLDPHGEFVDSASIEHFEHVLTVTSADVPKDPAAATKAGTSGNHEPST
jgi:heme-degrading monooxygenase HmoA